MSEFRAALQEVIMAGEACTKDDDIYNAVRYNRAMSAAKALLARPEPEPRITREEAMELLGQFFWARFYESRNDNSDLIRKTTEACLAAMGAKQ